MASAGPPDAATVDWCAFRLGIPEDLRYFWRRCVRDCARDIVQRHALEIVKTAMQLFRLGRVAVASPPPETAQQPDEPAGELVCLQK